MASRPSVVISTSRLRSNRRASSSRRARASSVRARATAERLLATRLTARNANSATQFCGSAIVNVPTGGRKKKLKASTATIDIATATRKVETAATTRTTSRNVVETVAAFEIVEQARIRERRRCHGRESAGEGQRFTHRA